MQQLCKHPNCEPAKLHRQVKQPPSGSPDQPVQHNAALYAQQSRSIDQAQHNPQERNCLHKHCYQCTAISETITLQVRCPAPVLLQLVRGVMLCQHVISLHSHFPLELHRSSAIRVVKVNCIHLPLLFGKGSVRHASPSLTSLCTAVQFCQAGFSQYCSTDSHG